MKALSIQSLPPKQDIQQGYTTKTSLEKVRSFLSENKKSFDRIENETGVSREIVASLLWLETLYGSPVLKTYPTLASLMSLAIFVNDDFRRWALPLVQKEAEKKYKSQESRAKSLGRKQKDWKSIDWDTRMKKIGLDWSEHVQAFFSIGEKLEWDQNKYITIEGSWAGAIGYSQFMPSTLLPILGKKKYDLWRWEDAIELTSIELQKKGFSKDIEKSLKAYNSPSWYREIILSVYEKITEESDKKKPLNVVHVL
ncbi:MAG: lytic murein transglycosylase [Bdellovibrionales bacterium]|nr:lytic murein transglycosylase [Bdellovibrionales bacterium]